MVGRERVQVLLLAEDDVFVNWDQSQKWSLIDIDATCQPSEAESTKAGLNESSGKYKLVKKRYNTKKNAERPPLSSVLVSMCVHCVEIPVQNIILRHPFFSKRQCMHSYAYATFEVMWIENIHHMYIISCCLNLANEIIMLWTVRVYNETWSDLKIYWKCDEKRFYFKTLQSKMVYLSIFMCFIYFKRAILEARLRWRYDVKI